MGDAIIEAQNYNIRIPSKILSQYNHELLQSLPEIKEQKQELIRKEFKCAKEINDQCTGNNRILFSSNKCEFDKHTNRFHSFSKNVKIEVTNPDNEVPSIKGAIMGFYEDSARREILQNSEIPVITFKHIIEKGVLYGQRKISDELELDSEYGEKLYVHPIEAKLFIQTPKIFEKPDNPVFLIQKVDVNGRYLPILQVDHITIFTVICNASLDFTIKMSFGESNVQFKDFKYSHPDFIVKISGEKDLFKPAKQLTIQSSTHSIQNEQIKVQNKTEGTELKQVMVSKLESNQDKQQLVVLNSKNSETTACNPNVIKTKLNESLVKPVKLDPKIVTFLENLNLGELRGIFEKEQLNMEELLKLSNDDLKDIGIRLIKHRKAILKGFEEFSQSGSNPSPAQLPSPPSGPGGAACLPPPPSEDYAGVNVTENEQKFDESYYKCIEG